MMFEIEIKPNIALQICGSIVKNKSVLL